MRTRLRRAALFVSLLPTLARLEVDVRALERAADRGEPTAARAAALRLHVDRAQDRLAGVV